jgi:hypothetical protein
VSSGTHSNKGSHAISTHLANPQESLQKLAQGYLSTLHVLQDLRAVTYEASVLDPRRSYLYAWMPLRHWTQYPFPG